MTYTTLNLFNVVLNDKTTSSSLSETIVSQTLPFGYIIDPSALHCAKEIMEYYHQEMLNGNQLNATFHKSWSTVMDSTEEELLVHQLLHYFSTYGMDALGIQNGYIYLPNEILEVPELSKVPIRVICGVSKDELVQLCVSLFESGIALKEQTIKDVFDILNALDYKFASVDNIKNKEAAIRVMDDQNVFPSNPMEFVRYLVYKATDSTTLIKNPAIIAAILTSKIDVEQYIKQYNLIKLAGIFNRYKPLFLAFKKANKNNVSIINKLSKLSKEHHVPMSIDFLNSVTALNEFHGEELTKALEKANNFRKIRLLYALNTRMNNPQDMFYRIRNGKSYVTKGNNTKEHYERSFMQVYYSFIESLNVKGKNILYPTNIDYALPSTEKMFIGNVPTGTKITVDGNMAAGVYWENSENGRTDLDLSAIGLGKKVGWNSTYNSGSLTYSGDITDAPNGATELLHVGKGLSEPTLAMLNVFTGDKKSSYKIVVGRASSVKKNHMFDPNDLLFEVRTETKGKGTIVGLFLPENDGISFIILDANFGNIPVSMPGGKSEQARNALFAQWSKPISMKQVLIDAGANIIYDESELINEEKVDIDLRYETLQKNTIIDLMT